MSSRPSRPIYCTAATAAQLPHVRLLLDSLRRTQGEVDFRLLLAEHPAVVAILRDQLGDMRVLAPDQIGCPVWLHMSFGYDREDYPSALKPWLLRTLLQDGDVIYFDPDVEVFSSLGAVEEALGQADAVLTPHVSRPLPADGCQPTMKSILHAGQFNLGFLGLRGGPATEEALLWWQEVMGKPSIGTVSEAPPRDSFWAAAFASLLPQIRCLRSAQYGMSHVNLCQRPLRFDDSGAPMTEDGPLVFFHHGALGLDQDRAVKDAAAGAPVDRLVQAYQARLRTTPYARHAHHPYSFACYIDGTEIPVRHRRAFLRLDPANRRLVYNPFAEHVFMDRLIAHSPTVQIPDPDVALARCLAAEQKLSSMPYSLIGYASRSMSLLMPRTKDRIYNVALVADRGLRRLHRQVRGGDYAQAVNDLTHFFGRVTAAPSEGA